MRPRLVVTPLLAAALACASGEPFNASEIGGGIGVASAPNPDGEETSTGDVDPTTAADPTADPTSSGTSSGAPATTIPEDPTTGSQTSDATTGPVVMTTGPAACDGPCDAPPGPCHASPGACVDGTCVYEPAADGAACDDGDPCTEGDACEAGACVGAAMQCSAPNATGGSCQGGVCQGFTCVAPYEDCDGDWANGCEVPTGVPNQCDTGGINPDGGCWTAYCGNLVSAGVTNFGTYYCVHCPNCHEPAAGQWQWCNSKSGQWFPSAAGNCPAAEQDLVCAP